jgi:hypothetical protein
MHLDFADGNAAIVSGQHTCMWFIKAAFQRNGETIFSITELPIPECLTIPSPPGNWLRVIHARSIHFLSESGSIIVSFVEDDIRGSTSKL